MNKLRVNDRIYFHGDMANAEGWFRVQQFEAHGLRGLFHVALQEEDGDRHFVISTNMVEPEYHGHAGTRFCTERAYKAWERGREQEYREWARKFYTEQEEN